MAKDYKETVFINGRDRTYEDGLSKRALAAADKTGTYNGKQPIGTTKLDEVHGTDSDYWSPSWGARQYGKMFNSETEAEAYRAKQQAAISG